MEKNMKMRQDQIKKLNSQINTLNQELQMLKGENRSLLEQMKMKEQQKTHYTAEHTD